MLLHNISVKSFAAIVLLTMPLTLAAAGGHTGVRQGSDRSQARVVAVAARQIPVASLVIATPQTPTAPQTAEYFEASIRPILAANCYDCHTEEQMGGLRLDSREAILKGGKSGPAIVPGDPDKSLMIAAVRQTSDTLKMPKGGKLKREDVEALTEWVRAGAFWPSAVKTAPATAPAKAAYVINPEQRAFWSFQPIHKPAVPAVAPAMLAAWPRTDIDRFVLARLEKEGNAALEPVKPADRLTLLRRATLDLTGLPPAPEEIDAFEKDSSPDAFAKVVDRLLASPQYGETWGRLWLDVARYGEDDYRSLDPMGRGYNPYPNAYLYRDWVIKAFNDDLPYDRFVKAQLAADLLDDKVRVKMLPALGFLGLGPWYYDNGAVEITRADERHDRVDVVSRGFLGLTVGCARCHDHKYDPIPTKDYYSMAGVFLNTVYKDYPLAPQSVVDEYKAQEKKVEKKQKLLNEFTQTESTQLAQTLALQASKYMVAAWKVTGEPKEDMARVADAEKLDYELFDRWIKFLAKPPKFYPYLNKWQEMIKSGGKAPGIEEARKLAEEFQGVLLDVMFERKEVKEENDIISAKALPGTKKKEPAMLPSDFITNDDFCPGCGLELKSMPIERTNLWNDVFSRDLKDVEATDDKFKPGLLSFSGWGLERQLGADRRRYIEGLRTDIADMKKALPAHFPYVHGVAEVEKPQAIKVHVRGSPHNLGDEVPRHFLSALSDGEPAPFKTGSGRLELADAILRQPLAMRVIVNRIWKGHFGTGLVDTPSNFGVTGERPTHPELLEYLAQSFVDNGMSVKKLHRTIMLSAVYQLSTEHSQKNFEKDPGNRLYWRANRHRMSAEQIRDSLLFVSGALDTKAGGPSAELTPSFNRRTVYGRISRYKLDEYLQLFDFPSPNLSSEKRFSTTVPLQRLFFMNSDFMQQQGELLAKRVASEPSTTAKIQKAYRLIFGRGATDAEVRAGIDYLSAEPMKEYEEKKTEADRVKTQKAKEKSQSEKGKNEKDGKDTNPAADADKPDAPPPMTADGMMAGVVPGAKRDEAKKLLPVTAWGRYVKILLSSSEFLFVN
jgi:hypothetical protein